jgi:hypothetical protein
VTARFQEHPTFLPVFQAINEPPGVQIVKRNYAECIWSHGLHVDGVSLTRSQLKRHLNWLVSHGLAIRIPFIMIGKPGEPGFGLQQTHCALRRGIYDDALDEWWKYKPADVLRDIARERYAAELNAGRAQLATV